MIGLIDTHFHLDMYKNYNEIFQYLEVEKQYTLCMTNSPGVFLSCRDLFQNSKYVKFALGFHPLNADLTSKDINDFVIPFGPYLYTEHDPTDMILHTCPTKMAIYTSSSSTLCMLIFKAYMLRLVK